MVFLEKILFLVVFLIHLAPYVALNSIIKKLGFVSVASFEENEALATQKWPQASGMKFTNTITPSGTVKIPRLYHQINTTNVQIKRETSRTFEWKGDELVILFNMTSLQSPLCTRLTPPLSWISASGCKVRVVHKSSKPSSALMDIMNEMSGIVDTDKKTAATPADVTSTIEIVASRSFVEGTLSCLRMNGFQREDLFRILDKGPWILAFDVRSIIPRLFRDLQTDLSLNQSQAVHIISHCPYLVAQYFKYKGRDVYATARALMEVGYSPTKLNQDVMRFPSMLASPPDRIRGWKSLLEAFDIAVKPGLFGKLLKKAPFMFYVNPPALNDIDTSMVAEDASTTASGFVAYEALKVLEVIDALDTNDMDKVIRTQPLILLESSEEIKSRINFLLNLFLEISVNNNPRSLPSTKEEKEDNSATWAKLLLHSNNDSIPCNYFDAQEQLGATVLTYPAILSISYEQMRAAANCLRDNGLRRKEVIFLAKRYAPVLNRSPADIKSVLLFFRYQCGLRKEDVVPFINKYPAIFGSDVSDLQAKVNYLYQSLGGTPGMIRKFPSFFSFDLDVHIRPRAEFLRALGMDPLTNGLVFLMTTPINDLCRFAGVKPNIFAEFNLAYLEMWKRKRMKDEIARLPTAPLRSFPTSPMNGEDVNRFSDTVDVIFDELDFGF